MTTPAHPAPLSEYLFRLRVALTEALHAATMTDTLPVMEAELCLDLLDGITAQMADLRGCIGRRARYNP
jgi:hypothetical protein